MKLTTSDCLYFYTPLKAVKESRHPNKNRAFIRAIFGNPRDKPIAPMRAEPIVSNLQADDMAHKAAPNADSVLETRFYRILRDYMGVGKV